MKITAEEEKLAQEMFGYVMNKTPWDHNVVILQSIYRKLAKELLKRYKLVEK